MKEAIFERDLPEQARLAKRNGIKDILILRPEINGSERMLLRKMSRVFYNQNVDQAFHLWSQIVPQSESQIRALAIDKDTFIDLYKRAKDYLSSEGANEHIESMIRGYREKDSPRGPGYRWNDEHQMSQKETRSLAKLHTSGIRISVPENHLDVLRGYSDIRPGVSLIESAKNDRIATINGFSGSLMTLVIHDSFDHYYVNTILRKTGLEERYSQFFDSVGNPSDTDLFSREGELIASPAYAYRLWSMVEPGIEPTITAEKASRLIKKGSEATQNQKNATDFLSEDIINDPEQARKYGYVITSVVIELLEQRRKQGLIRKLDKNHNVVGNLSLTDPEYLSFIVDTTRMLAESQRSAFQAVSNIAILIEEYFRLISSPNFKSNPKGSLPPNLQDRVIYYERESVPTLRIKLSDMDDDSIFAKSGLSSPVAEWISKNPGFTATQQQLI